MVITDVHISHGNVGQGYKSKGYWLASLYLLLSHQAPNETSPYYIPMCMFKLGIHILIILRHWKPEVENSFEIQQW